MGLYIYLSFSFFHTYITSPALTLKEGVEGLELSSVSFACCGSLLSTTRAKDRDKEGRRAA